MHWSKRLPRVQRGMRLRAHFVFGALLAVGACVSLSSPGPRGGNVPVVRTGFKNGRDQIVRIALATASPAVPVRPPANGSLVVRPEGNSPFVLWSGKRYRGDLVITESDSGFMVVNRLSIILLDSHIGKGEHAGNRYRNWQPD